jgi:hypothetical protein
MTNKSTKIIHEFLLNSLKQFNAVVVPCKVSLSPASAPSKTSSLALHSKMVPLDFVLEHPHHNATDEMN